MKQGLFREMPQHVAVGGRLGMSNWQYAGYDDKGPLSPEQIVDHFTALLSDGQRRPSGSARR